MEFQTYLRILRRRWVTVLLAPLLTVFAAGVMTLLTPQSFQSTVKFFVSTTSADGADIGNLAQGGTFTMQRVQSYTQLFKTPTVLDPVISTLKLKTTASQLAGSVTARASQNSFIIDVSVVRPTPDEAQAVASTIATQFPTTVTGLETTAKGSASPIKVTVIQPASVQQTPVSPRPLRNYVVAGVLGLLLGVGLALVRHLLDTRVRTAADLAEVTDATVIGAVPFDGEAPRHPVAVQSDPHAPRAEAFRTVRTNLRFVDAAKHPRVLVTTSSIPGEGKTTVTANLALAIAQSNATACVIEADLRRPKLLEYLGLEGSVGLTDVLIGRVGLDDVLQPYGREDLWLLGAGALPPNPSELLGSNAMREVIEQLRQRFDYVLIDAPPLLPVTDAAVLTAITDGAVLIVGSGLVTRDQVAGAQAHLENVSGRLIGVILNRVSVKGPGSYYGAYTYDYSPDREKLEPMFDEDGEALTRRRHLHS